MVADPPKDYERINSGQVPKFRRIGWLELDCHLTLVLVHQARVARGFDTPYRARRFIPH